MLECWAGTTRVKLGGPVHERVLVGLLLEPGQVLPVSRLVEAVWDDAPPATAGHQVRKAVAKLRQVIPGGAELIATEGSGYRVVTDGVYLDLDDFLARLAHARQAVAAGRTADAVQSLQQAIDLWRGPVLSGGGGRLISTASAALQERHLAAVEQLMQLRLDAGEAVQLVGDLVELVAAHPLRETLHAQLMLALFRSGRQAEALEAYTRVQRLLADELGIDPDARLTELRDAILRNDSSLAVVPLPERLPEPVADTVVPECSLPYDLRDFTGRERELRDLLDHAREPGGRSSRIVAIDGMGGVGKTSLAVRAAYLLAEHYPDGQLYVDLHGFTEQRQPMSVDAVAETLLGSLGAPGDRIPGDAQGRIAEWRAIAAQRRLLVLLDNAWDAAQVRPLLPPGANSMMVVTSRARLVDLDGAHWISLGTMTPENSAAMLAETLGEKRVAAEPDAATALAELCGHLPLAMRIASARLHNRPRWTIAYLVERLGNESRKLDELRSGERSVELTLTLSYLGLEFRHRTALRLLALHPGHNVEVYSAAALLGTTLHEAEETLEHLLDVHLIQQHELGYYAFHDLVRSFAHRLGRTGKAEGGRADNDDGGREDREAVARLLDFYVLVTDRACDLAFPGRVPLRSGLPETGVIAPLLRDADHARAWLDHEQNALRDAVLLAHRIGLHRHAAALARNVVFQLDAKGQFEDYREVAAVAVEASRHLEHEHLLRMSLSNLAVADWKLGRFYDGIAAATEALQLAVRLGDRRGEAKDTGVLGVLLGALGRFDEALSRLRESVALKRELGASRAEAESLTNLSTLYEQWGHYEEAAAAARRALVLNRELGDRNNELVSLTDLATALLGLGQDHEARECLDRARELMDKGFPAADCALVLALSAKAAHRGDERERVRAFADEALSLGRTSRTPIRQARIENVLGGLEMAAGRYESALELHTNAHRIASAVSYQVEEARALLGLAQVHEAIGNAAAEYRRRADELFDELGIDVRFRRSD
ncbi:AfsR/SARP family transcriptional regulator [Lentzea sp.]|uniref:AfsR/SARP family transcriptional regulator n=1 Tax=Lentzea sp. TaxID=56099 RepID=UPI002BA0F377|nr:BTAD domain-containing putative transcriptional regulator [Lentzea sp.]HUQ54065.1 BTAD domain-containing putative transcriptional regulator [Lentzea sp.]